MRRSTPLVSAAFAALASPVAAQASWSLVHPGSPAPVGWNFVFASHEYGSFHLLMPLYLVRRWEGTVRAVEHKALAWVKPNDMDRYPMPPADPPLVAWLRDLL